MPKVKLRKSRGTIATISLLFLSSALLRLFVGAESVLAEAAKIEQSSEVAEQPTQVALTESEFTAINQALKDREDRVKEQELQITKRMKALEIADRKVQEQLAALERAEEELRQTIALADDAAENDIQRLTAVYEAMKPKTAAALFQEMNPEFAAGFIGRMRPEAAAAIIEGMSSTAAYAVSAILAGRNADVPVGNKQAEGIQR